MRASEPDRKLPGVRNTPQRRGCVMRRSRRAALLLATVISAAGSAARAGGGSWISPLGGTWQAGGNWSTSAQPNSSDVASFNLASAYTVFFNGNGVAGDVNVSAGTVDFDLSTYTLSSSAELQIAYASGNSAGLTLQNGTASFAGSGVQGIGIVSSAVGQLTLDASTLTLSNSSEFDVGDHGTGTLLIQNGARATFNSSVVGGYHGGNGWIQVDGVNSRLSAGSFLDVGDGGGGGNGTLIVQNGAQADGAGATIIGFRSGNGYASVSGANSTLHSSEGILDIGDGGAGTLLVQSSGHASSDTAELYVGFNTGGVGNVSVTSGGSLSSVGAIIGGLSGVGSVSLSGSGSAWANSGSLYVGNDGTDIPAGNGTGTLALSSAATISVAGNLRLYNGQASIDAATLTQSSGDEFTVGDRGTARLSVQNAGRIDTSASVVVGYHGGFGTATLSGSNSSLVVSGSGIIDIGDGGTGTLSILSGAAASTPNDAYIGFGSGNGTLSVSGANSSFSAGGSLTIGNAGNGTLTLANNASANVTGTLKVHSTGYVSLGSGASLSVGTLDLSGTPANFSWTGGTLRINNSAAATDGALAVPSNGTLGGNGTINRSTTVAPGGTLDPGSSVGKLSFTESLTLQTSAPNHAVFQVELGGDPTVGGNAGTTFDQVVVSGTSRVFVVGGATLQVIPLPTVQLNKAYPIVKVAGGATVNYSSVFSNLASGGTHYHDAYVTYDVSYDTSTGVSVTFTSVPEPTSLCISTAILTCSILPRRRRKSQHITRR